MDERAELLRRLAAAGASQALQRDCRDAPVDQLRSLVDSLEAAPRRPSLEDVWADDSAAYAEAERVASRG